MNSERPARTRLDRGGGKKSGGRTMELRFCVLDTKLQSQSSATESVSVRQPPRYDSRCAYLIWNDPPTGRVLTSPQPGETVISVDEVDWFLTSTIGSLRRVVFWLTRMTANEVGSVETALQRRKKGKGEAGGQPPNAAEASNGPGREGKMRRWDALKLELVGA